VKRDDESADQAIAKVLPFPARTDCSADERVRATTGLKEARVTLGVEWIERKSK
jgi:hypothetical protein